MLKKLQDISFWSFLIPAPLALVVAQLPEAAGFESRLVLLLLQCKARFYATLHFLISYSHYESGTRSIPVELLIELANLHQANLDYLAGRTDSKEMLPARKKG